MDSVDIDDIDQDRFLTRSNSWSHAQRPAFLDTSQSIGGRRNGLSCIYESDDPVPMNQDREPLADSYRNRSKSIGGGTAGQAQTKKRRHSYTELIASAILSSSEKRKTLAEIYDWFVLNVPTFKDQRYMHSSLGWKNAVRHNLSVQTCFKRVKRHGMEKPSWWTVDLAEVAKRRLVLCPRVHTDNSKCDTEMDNGEPFLPPRRNSYSGPHPTILSSAVSNDTSGVNKINYRVASTNDLVSATNLQFLHPNAKRTHYAPIRPAISTQQSDTTTRAMFTLGNSGYASEATFGEMTGHGTNQTNLDDTAFLKPCALDTSLVGSNNNNNSPPLVPSVTLVCKESPTSNHPYRQAQLEVSFQANEDSSSIASSTSSPGVYSWTSSTSSPCSQASPGSVGQLGSSMSHFSTWPTIAEPNATTNRVGVPNQTLRVKTVWGNVQDINFTGLLPMRTVVKCDGTTQTEETNEKRNLYSDIMSKSLEGPQWDQTFSNRYDQSYNSFQSALTADLPEDLARLEIEGDLHCDIEEVLGASLEPSTVKPTLGWSWNGSQFEPSPFGDRFEDPSYPSLARSSFNYASMDTSEL